MFLQVKGEKEELERELSKQKKEVEDFGLKLQLLLSSQESLKADLEEVRARLTTLEDVGDENAQLTQKLIDHDSELVEAEKKWEAKRKKFLVLGVALFKSCRDQILALNAGASLGIKEIGPKREIFEVGDRVDAKTDVVIVMLS